MIAISNEELVQWREEAAQTGTLASDLQERVLRLLDALRELDALFDASTEETRACFSALYHVATEIIPDLKKQIADAEARAEKAERERDALRASLATLEAKVQRLEASRRWLAKHCSTSDAIINESDPMHKTYTVQQYLEWSESEAIEEG